MENKIIQTPCGELTWLIPGLILKETFTKLESVEDVEEYSRLLLENFYIDNKPITALVDITGLKKSPKKEVRDYLASNDEIIEKSNASAILTGSNLTKIMGNIFMKFSRPQYPTKLFTDEEKALEWLKKMIGRR